MARVAVAIVLAAACGHAAALGAHKVEGLPGLNVTSLTVTAPEGQAARVVLGTGDARYSFGVHADGTFAISKGLNKDVLTINQDGDLMARTQLLSAASVSADKGFVVDTVPQWALWKSEDFAGPVEEWSVSDVTRCGGVTMLGGYQKTSKTLVTKKFAGLPEHARVRVVATYHFIDLWQGEVGFMQLSSGEGGAMEYVWTDRYELQDSAGVVNVCGRSNFGEGHFSVPIDVTLVHSGEDLTVTFGSTLTSEASEASFGISSVQIYVRNA